MRLVFTLLVVALEIQLGVWARLPLGIWIGCGVAAAALIFRAIKPGSLAAWGERTFLAALWAGSLMIWYVAARDELGADTYYSIMAGLAAAAVWVASGRGSNEIWRSRWNAQVMAWLFCSALNWLAAGYLLDATGLFYGGLLATLACLALCRWWFRWGALGRQALSTLMLLLVGLPLADAVRRPLSRIPVRAETFPQYYSYTAAKGDPDAFREWEDYYGLQFHQLGLAIFEPDPARQCPFILRPKSRGTFVSCPISINSLGFRGPEFSLEKGDAYRIVALGESTTFGMTSQPGDTPWPEMLERLIRERLKTKRPVQVINAGVPAYSIVSNLKRFARDLLPLRPDLLISYHGANGFYMFDESVLPPTGPVPPAYQDRPIKLAGDVEHRLRMMACLYKAHRRQPSTRFVTGRPIDTAYGAAYRRLIKLAAANGMRLAVANYSMAVNGNTDPRVIDFYQGGRGRVSYGYIRANAFHSLLINQLAQEYTNVCFIDTHPHLDGEHEKFIDIMHLTNEGRRQMAENIFQGIRGILQRDLAPP